MAQAFSDISPHSSRLVRLLKTLGVSGANASGRQFARRLGQLVDLQDSIAISAVHIGPGTVPTDANSQPGESIKEEFLTVRASMVRSVIHNVVPREGAARERGVRVLDQPEEVAEESHARYLRLYVAQQREIIYWVRRLQAQVRESVAPVAPELAQLAALDEALGDALAGYSRKQFARVTVLLRKRFESLAAEANVGTEQELNEQICAEMREILLAEIDARLLPVQGLIEALEKHLDK